MGLLAQYSTGALQRTSPIPIGQYWIDVFTPKQVTFDNWLAKAGAKVAVVSTEAYEGTSDWPPHNWYLFHVNSPVEWPQDVAIQIGYPTIAGPDVQSSDDTVQKPNPEQEVADKWGWLKWAVGGVIVVGGIYSVAKLVRG